MAKPNMNLFDRSQALRAFIRPRYLKTALWFTTNFGTNELAFVVANEDGPPVIFPTRFDEDIGNWHIFTPEGHHLCVLPRAWASWPGNLAYSSPGDNIPEGVKTANVKVSLSVMTKQDKLVQIPIESASLRVGKSVSNGPAWNTEGNVFNLTQPFDVKQDDIVGLPKPSMRTWFLKFIGWHAQEPVSRQKLRTKLRRRGSAVFESPQ